MVGVARSHGCATCRQRKIKCDETKPSCLKCVGKGYSCPGYGSRLKWQDEGVALRKRLDKGHGQPEPQAILHSGVTGRSGARTLIQSQNNDSIQTLDRVPNRLMMVSETDAAIRGPLVSPADELASQFFETFRPDLPRGKSLAAFGKFILEIPRRIGASKACDLAIRTIYLAHGSLLKGGEENAALGRVQYGKALVELRICLYDRQQAFSADTLCATILLAVYELLADTDKTAAIRHAGGAARLIELSGVDRIQEPYALELFKGFRLMIVFEAIFNRHICFLGLSPWKRILAEPTTRSRHPFESLYALLPRLPNILSSLRSLKASLNPPTHAIASLLCEAISLREDLNSWHEEPSYADILHTVSLPSSITFFPSKLSFSSNIAAVMLCTYRSMLILVNCVILQLEASNSVASPENQTLAEQICQSYAFSTDYAPFGNCHMSYALRAAYLVTQDIEKQAWIVQAMIRLKHPPVGHRSMAEVAKVAEELDSYFDYLKL